MATVHKNFLSLPVNLTKKWHSNLNNLKQFTTIKIKNKKTTIKQKNCTIFMKQTFNLHQNWKLLFHTEFKFPAHHHSCYKSHTSSVVNNNIGIFHLSKFKSHHRPTENTCVIKENKNCFKSACMSTVKFVSCVYVRCVCSGCRTDAH